MDLLSLRTGGYTIFARHGEATVGQDQPNLRFDDCSTQRNLSDYGRRQSIFYGQMLRYVQIPVVYPVEASPLCRAIQTAQLAFGDIFIKPLWFDAYLLSTDLSFHQQQSILASIDAELEIKPEQGYNRMIVAHSFPKGIGLGSIPDMGTVIIRPRGIGNGYDVVGTYSLEELYTLLLPH